MREFVIEDELEDYDTGSGFYQVLFVLSSMACCWTLNSNTKSCKTRGLV